MPQLQAGAIADRELAAPLPVRNLYPPMMRFFDPVPDSALRAYRPDWQLELTQHYATVNMIENRGHDRLLVDMELYLLDLTLRHAPTERLELTLRAPLLLPLSGVFDRPIQAFHRRFGMPNGGRELRPNNRFGYHFEQGGALRWRGDSRIGSGNVALSARYHLLRSGDGALAALTAVKLPTASAARGWGSGGADLAAGLLWSQRQGGWQAHLEGWLIQPLATAAGGQRYRRYLRGSLTLAYQPAAPLALLVQAQGGGSPYRSGLATLDQAPFLISFGLRGRQAGCRWTLAVIENITQLTTQDISLAFALSWPL